MTFAVGIFDLFTYAIPGSLHLAFMVYVINRLDWLHLNGMGRMPAGLLLLGIIFTSYLVGHLTYRLNSFIDHRLGLRQSNLQYAQNQFLENNPIARKRAYVLADPHLLLAAAELASREVAAEISRLRAIGLMVRNCRLPLALGLAASVVEFAQNHNRPFAAACAAAFVIAVGGSHQHGQKLQGWAVIKTLEVCYWIPDIDDKVAPPASDAAL